MHNRHSMIDAGAVPPSDRTAGEADAPGRASRSRSSLRGKRLHERRQCETRDSNVTKSADAPAGPQPPPHMRASAQRAAVSKRAPLTSTPAGHGFKRDRPDSIARPPEGSEEARRPTREIQRRVGRACESPRRNQIYQRIQGSASGPGPQCPADRAGRSRKKRAARPPARGPGALSTANSGLDGAGPQLCGIAAPGAEYARAEAAPAQPPHAPNRSRPSRMARWTGSA